MQSSKNSMVYVLCSACVCVDGRVLESYGFAAVHVEMFSYGNSSVLNQEYIVAIHKVISFNLG